MSLEDLVADIVKRHDLTNIHLFTQGKTWRSFGFRQNVKGFQASAEEGRGMTLLDALESLDERLIEGPIHK